MHRHTKTHTHTRTHNGMEHIKTYALCFCICLLLNTKKCGQDEKKLTEKNDGANDVLLLLLLLPLLLFLLHCHFATATVAVAVASVSAMLVSEKCRPCCLQHGHGECAVQYLWVASSQIGRMWDIAYGWVVRVAWVVCPFFCTPPILFSF